MSTPDVPVHDIEIFRGITFTRSFKAQVIDDNGNVTGDFDLTGFNVVLILRDALDEDLTLDSNDGANTEGSIIQITDEVAGEFDFLLTPATTARVRQRTGDYRIERRSGPLVSDLFVRGTVSVGSLGTGGEI